MRRKTGAALVLLLALAGTSPARALVTGTISGRVTDQAGAPIAQICVYAESVLPGPTGYTTTAADGTYEIEDLDPGAYRVRFSDCYPYRARAFETEWYDDSYDKAGASLVLVTAAPVTGIDASLIPKGAVVGRVTDQFGAPLVGFCVSLVKDAAWHHVQTGLDGRYLVTGEHGQVYTLGFGHCGQEYGYEVYIPEWHDDVPSESEAAIVEPQRGTEIEIDAVVERTGTISGEMRDTDGALTSTCAMAYTPDGELASYADMYGEQYMIGSLHTGTYYVQFRDCHVGGVVTEWYGDASDMAGATPVVVEYGHDTPNIDGVLAKTGTVSGRITDPDGNPVQACVSAWDPNGFPYVGGASDEDGYYTLPWVQPEIQLTFGGDCGDHPVEWYNDAPERADADIVHVPPATDVTGIDAVIGIGDPPCEHDTGDIDGDGLNNCEEFTIYGTNAYDPDTDNDRFGDGFEVHGGTCGPYTYEGGSDPNDGSSTPVADLPASLPSYDAPYAYLVVLCV
jgi:hypothetical protein